MSMIQLALPEILKLAPEDLERIKAWGYTIHHYSEASPSPHADIEVWVGNPQNPLPGIPENLKFLQLLSAGYDSLPLDILKERGILLANARGIYSVAIAEYCISYILAIYRKHLAYQKQQEEAQWKKILDLKSLEDKNVLFLGSGSIAQETAKRLKAFGCKLYATNSDGRLIEPFDACYPLKSLKQHLPQADIVIVTLPLNDATYHIISHDELSMMKKDAVLINIGRGQCVDLDAVYAALDETLEAVVLDVFAQEPLPETDPLWHHPKAIITPHSSFASDHINQKRIALVLKNLKRYAHKETVLNRINL